jgi:hypothetical protein
VLPLQWFVLQLQGFNHRSGIVFFFFSLFVVGLGASIMYLGYFIIAESKYNWYICDINIFLYQKNLVRALSLSIL